MRILFMLNDALFITDDHFRVRVFCPVTNMLGNGLKLTNQWYQSNFSTLDELGTGLVFYTH